MWLSDKVIYNLEGMRKQREHQRKKARKAAKMLRGAVPDYRKGMGKEFYRTREWRELRWQVLVASDGKCCMCGRCKKDGAVLHVDHKQPRSKYPERELDFSNLQVLCEDCNLGKSNT